MDTTALPRKIVIYGAGGLGREVLQLVRDTDADGTREILGFIDDGVEAGVMRNDAVVLGDMEYLDTLSEPIGVVFGVADPRSKEKRYHALRANPLVSFPSVIHPRALIRAYVSIEEGVVIVADCHVSVNVRIGRCVLLDDSATIGHDVEIGDFSSILPQAAVSGNIDIGVRCLLGVGCMLRQGISVGADSVVGMGSVVLQDIPAGTTVYGNPARPARPQQ